MNFTEDQETAILNFKMWCNNTKNKQPYILVGAAGSGKTTIVKEFIKYLRSHFRHKNVCVIAPTNQAVNKIKELTDHPYGYTVHSALGLRLNIDIDKIDVNKPQFDPRSKPKIWDNDYAFIDESSMISSNLYKLLLKQAAVNRTKLIFIGDACQLKSVEGNDMPALERENGVFNELTTIVRQSNGHPVLELLDIVREDVKNNTFNFLAYIHRKPRAWVKKDGEDIGYEVLNGKAFEAKVLEYFNKEEYSKDINFVKFLAYKNNTIIKANDFIRYNIIEGSENDVIVPYDLLTCYETIVEELGDDSVSPIIVNSENYIVKKVTPMVNSYNISGYIVLLVNWLTKKEISLFIMDHTIPENVSRHIEILKELYNNAIPPNATRRSTKFKSYFNAKNSTIILKDMVFYGINPFAKSHNDEIRKIDVSKQLDYGYGITIHKSQGSTYNTVFVDLKDINNFKNKYISTNEKIDLRNRLFYVSVSRASHRIFIKTK